MASQISHTSESTTLLSRRIRLRHLVVADAVAINGSIGAAGAALHLTQPAVSRTIAELEKALGVKLFDRGPKGMAVSDEGTELIPHVHAIVAEAGSLLRHADEMVGGGGGEVRVGTLLAGTADTLPDAVFEFSSRYPGTRVTIAEGTPDRLHEDLMTGRVDLVLGRAAPLAFRPGVDFERLYDDEVKIVCSPEHPRAGHHEVGLADLVDEEWILPPAGTALRQQVEAEFIRECGRSPGSVIECVAAMPLRALVLRGRHLSVVPSGIFKDEIDQGRLVTLPLDVGGTAEPVGIMTRSGAERTSTAANFVAVTRELKR